jgi:rSAM/selenodomain-associated transferase 1
VADSNVLLVFIKHPQPGAATTRLIPALGSETAAELYRVLAEEQLRRTRPRPGDYRRTLLFAPEGGGTELRSWIGDEPLHPQVGAEPGARFTAAFARAFEEGASRVAMIGTDVPWISRELVLEAFEALEGNDVVLGPEQDGGYYLLALARSRPALFKDIPWSTPAVLSATAERAGALGLSVKLLEPLGDIDTIEDLRAEWKRLRPLLESRKDLLVAVESALGG